MQNPEYEIFDANSFYYDDIFEACMFSALCMFIHDTKKIKAMSISDFLYEHSPYKKHYKDRRYIHKKVDDNLTSEETSLRQKRYRLLSQRPVYIKRPEGSAIPKSSEHEMSFLYPLTLDGLENAELRDTYKKIGNLYKNVSTAFNSANDEGYPARLDKAYKSFTNKLKKIKYEKSVELQHEILEHICENERYYGMNIYRFEKLLRFWNIGYEVTRLLDCKGVADEEARVLETSVRLNNVWFPNIYKKFAEIDSHDEMEVYAILFGGLMNQTVISSRLILDGLVEEGIFGTDGEWENLFLDTINQMTDKVFYNPREISSVPDSELPEVQEAFQLVLDAHVKRAIESEKRKQRGEKNCLNIFL